MNQEKQLSNIKILTIIGFSFSTISFSLAIITFVVPQWVTYISNKVPVGNSWTDYNRIKGIFQECLRSFSTTLVVTVSPPYQKRDNCTDVDIGQYGVQSSDDKYTEIIRIRQSQIGLHGAAILLLFIIVFMGIGIFIKWCCGHSDSSFYIKWRLTLGFLSFIEFLCFAASSGLGTALIIVENTKAYSTSGLPYSPFEMSTIKFKYGEMFYVAWVGTFTSLLSCILYFASAYFGQTLELEKYKPRVVASDNPSFVGQESKTSPDIFLQPTVSSLGSAPNFITPNEIRSPGLLPRYDVSNIH